MPPFPHPVFRQEFGQEIVSLVDLHQAAINGLIDPLPDNASDFYRLNTTGIFNRGSPCASPAASNIPAIRNAFIVAPLVLLINLHILFLR
jgi:hypothetical protein